MVTFLKRIQQVKTVEDAITLLYEIRKTPAIEKAVHLAQKFHEGQYRKSGEPYIIHPLLVAAITAFIGGDDEMITAALLHDVIEDTHCQIDEIEREFSRPVARLVEGMTKITELRDEKLIPSTSNEKLITSALSFRKMLIASIEDVRVLVVKLCDRLHNMLTLDALSPQKQRRISEETLVVYVPIAHRLGISKIKNTLEDLCFSYLFPQEFQKINDYLASHEQRMQLQLNNFISKVKTLLLKNGFIDGEFEIQKRIKHPYSIYMKMQRKGVSIEEVLDLMAIRILVRRPLECYKVLGIIHQNFKPLISRFKDYIAIPKDNGYQTIHTTVFSDSSIFETQIRTFDMHKSAEYGLASHWMYKGHEGLTPKLAWLNDLRSQSEIGENIEHMYQLAKDDLYSADISVYSPKGDVFNLPLGATALDFAYAVHTEIGDHTKAAYINKKRAPLLTELRNGDIVRIELSGEPILRCSWINQVKTAKAKNAMRINCNHKRKELDKLTAVNILLGVFNLKYETLQPYLEQLDVCKNIHKAATDTQYLQEIIYQLKKHLLADRKFIPIISAFKKYQLRKQVFDNIVVYGTQHYTKVTFDYCCHPKRGDEIVGIKKGNEVIVHHKFCTMANAMMSERHPMVFVRWSNDLPEHYKLIVSIENKKGSLAAFLLFLAKIGVDLLTINLSRSENSQADYFEMVVDIPAPSKEKLLQHSDKKFKIIEFMPLNDAYKK